MQKLIKFLNTSSLIILTLIILTLQIILNSAGYNYIVFILLIILIFYFDEIKKLTFGKLEIEKYERVADLMDERIAPFFKWLLKFTVEKIQPGFACEDAVHENYPEFMEIISDIQQLPTNIKKHINEAIKHNARFLAYQQLRRVSKEFIFLEDYRIDMVFGEIEKNSRYSLNEINQAEEAYSSLKILAENGIL